MAASLKYIKGFDGLRAFSILMVLITHLGLFHILPESNFIKQRVWLLISGSTGVNIFFTISGFLITKILITEKIEKAFISFKNFYIRRFLRLIPPLLVLYVILLILMSLGYISSDRTAIFLSAIYFYNFVSSTHYTSELGHTWSLALEEQFYLLWPFVINYFKDKRIILVSLVIILLCVLAKHFLPLISVDDTLVSRYYKVNRWFFPAVAPIIIGSLIAVLEFRFQDLIAPYLKKKMAFMLLSLALFFSPLYFPIDFILMSYIPQAFGISMLLLWIVHNQESRFSKVLEFKPLAYIGKISYGLYVYQGLFLTTGPGGSLDVQQYPLNILLTFAVAIVSYEFYEKKVLKLKRYFK